MEREDNAPKQNGLSTAPYKKREFECYVQWLSLPPILRGQPRHVLERMGIDDDMALSLLEIRNQTEFASRFGIKDPGTLTDWNKRVEANGGLLREINAWARKLTPNVILALHREATKTGRAAEVRAWMEIVEGQ